MEQKDSDQKQEVVEKKEEASAEEVTPSQPKTEEKEESQPTDTKKEEEKVHKKKPAYVFKECPETSIFTQEQLETENSKTLDPIEVTKMFRPRNSYGKRVRISAFSEEDSDKYKDTEVRVCGWAKTLRSAAKGTIYFVQINDGSSVGILQVVVDQ